MLPVYKLTINDDPNDKTGVDYVALVEYPAIEHNFLAFGKDRATYAIEDEERRIVSGAAMIADLPIYRKANSKLPEHYTVFDKETIFKIVKKRAKNNYFNNVNAFHQDPIEGVYLLESFITDSSRGIVPPKAFADLTEGSWFLSYYVENDQVWQDVKDGKFKGFSVEGYFDYVDSQEEELMASELEELIKLIKIYKSKK